MIQLQIALDGDLASSMAVLEATAPFVDIVEIGTPLIYREGMNAIRAAHGLAAKGWLLADLKIMDAGEEEASIAFEAGSNWVTVLGVTQDNTVRGAVAAAQRYSQHVMADLMQVADPVERGRELLDMGCDCLCIHTAHDVQGQSSLDRLARLRNALPEARLAAAGGISLSTIDAILRFRPQIVVVGSAITQTENPAAAARALRSRMEHYEQTLS